MMVVLNDVGFVSVCSLWWWSGGDGGVNEFDVGGGVVGAVLTFFKSFFGCAVVAVVGVDHVRRRFFLCFGRAVSRQDFTTND